ncbi:homeobox domain containing protein [Grosmannia clavigera kw1407]|uniref:Homeobox domain containing protein n=1 Tax=Grosmannia clavigera (strain kw1407 / UAMH 11150) TaxID=655863 RepID=F0XGZ0_GROCL|nr:homeobox domain containing protein [Grosmannia clavigera kw1407]EFX02681.1 homeobox domain containing protein [Grosmannia clavigera kw1407]
MGDLQPPYLTIRSFNSGNGSRMNGGGDGNSLSSADSAYASASGDYTVPSTTHDISRANYHVKHLDMFAKSLEDSASRAFPNRGRSQQRYTKVKALLLHWKSDDLFVLPELEDLEKCMREDYGYETDTFPIPSENAHLELMLRLGAMIKDHESPDTLFVVYYGGHARIDESRQSTWCAWSAIQTLLERSMSDTLILLDCCAGAASATFPNGKSITETISASSWDAIAPDPGRYSFTNALIEVLQEWRIRTFSAAMLHAEVLARLKHPRPITINGKLFEARSTPVHFMMTSNHRAPSIEIGRMIPRRQQLPSPPMDDANLLPPPGGRGALGAPVNDPNEDTPHVMISLALEDDQDLDLNAWEQWLGSFPALAKYVKVQGIFKSHSTLLLLSVPVMVWDLLPENRACSFVAFIRSNNLLKEKESAAPATVSNVQKVGDDGAAAEFNDDVVSEDESEAEDVDKDTVSVISGTTFTPTEGQVPSIRMSIASTTVAGLEDAISRRPSRVTPTPPMISTQNSYRRFTATDPRSTVEAEYSSSPSRQSFLGFSQNRTTKSSLARQSDTFQHHDSSNSLSKTMVVNPQKAARRTTFDTSEDLPDSPILASHVADRLEEYFQREPNPSVGITEFFASNLGVETRDIDLWFHRRRQQESTRLNLQNLRMDSNLALENSGGSGAKTIFPGHLNRLLDIFPPSQLLFVDLRSPTDFDKSHIYGAVNLRVPASLVEQSYDLLSLAFTDDQSRRTFAKGPSARCVVFYDRVIEFAWECPVAEALVQQLRESENWKGDFYVLKGHYREFSSSFDKYIAGDRMTQAAKDYADGLRQRSAPSAYEIEMIEERYSEWKTLVDDESRMQLTDATSKLDGRRQAVEQHQAELEAELESRNPVLYRKAMGLRQVPLKSLPAIVAPSHAGKDHRTDLAEPLSRGLRKMQGHQSYKGMPAAYDKLGELADATAASGSDDFDEIDPREEQFQDDPAFLKAGDLGGMGMGRGDSMESRRGRERSFWKRLRTSK